VLRFASGNGGLGRNKGIRISFFSCGARVLAFDVFVCVCFFVNRGEQEKNSRRVMPQKIKSLASVFCFIPIAGEVASGSGPTPVILTARPNPPPQPLGVNVNGDRTLPLLLPMRCAPISASSLCPELELELTQPHVTQKPMLRGEVGARALRNPEERGKGRKVVHTSEHVAAWWDARACMCCRLPLALISPRKGPNVFRFEISPNPPKRCEISRKSRSLKRGEISRKSRNKGQHQAAGPQAPRELELELELIQSQMAQKPMLRGEVGACEHVEANGDFEISLRCEVLPLPRLCFF
jgi:hypothetical protein